MKTGTFVSSAMWFGEGSRTGETTSGVSLPRMLKVNRVRARSSQYAGPRVIEYGLSRHTYRPISGMLYRPVPRCEVIRRTSIECASSSNGPSSRSSASAPRRSTSCPLVSRRRSARGSRPCSRMACETASSCRNSTARAGHSATSAASCSSNARVPLRRRFPTVCATSRRGARADSSRRAAAEPVASVSSAPGRIWYPTRSPR